MKEIKPKPYRLELTQDSQIKKWDILNFPQAKDSGYENTQALVAKVTKNIQAEIITALIYPYNSK
jgi:hypothetical protein